MLAYLRVQLRQARKLVRLQPAIFIRHSQVRGGRHFASLARTCFQPAFVVRHTKSQSRQVSSMRASSGRVRNENVASISGGYSWFWYRDDVTRQPPIWASSFWGLLQRSWWKLCDESGRTAWRAASGRRKQDSVSCVINFARASDELCSSLARLA